jgi:hypothetical protein
MLKRKPVQPAAIEAAVEVTKPRFRRGSGDGMYAQRNLTQHGKPDAMDIRDIQPAWRERVETGYGEAIEAPTYERVGKQIGLS